MNLDQSHLESANHLTLQIIERMRACKYTRIYCTFSFNTSLNSSGSSVMNSCTARHSLFCSVKFDWTKWLLMVINARTLQVYHWPSAPNVNYVAAMEPLFSVNTQYHETGKKTHVNQKVVSQKHCLCWNQQLSVDLCSCRHTATSVKISYVGVSALSLEWKLTGNDEVSMQHMFLSYNLTLVLPKSHNEEGAFASN